MFLRLQIIPLFLFAVVLNFGCSSPSDQEILSSVTESIEQNYPSQCTKFKMSDLNIGKIGNKQSSDSINWWPARVKATGKCFPKNKPIFEDSNGIDTTLTIEYKLQKNEYGEWEAVLRNKGIGF